ncbi:MAG: hypothetical protein AW12_01601 [Candidatus Accumulibacter sp. BA-94]|nr:MAG: hypothetical protein AW12_01601 [Candidatus Accumulibacter sp. BA-94]
MGRTPFSDKPGRNSAFRDTSRTDGVVAVRWLQGPLRRARPDATTRRARATNDRREDPPPARLPGNYNAIQPAQGAN